MSKSIEEWWACLGWRNWVEDISGNIWLFIWVLHIHSAPCAGFGLPASRLLAEKSKAAAHELVFIFFPSSLETFPELYFSTLTYISFFPLKDSRLQNFASAGLSLPPCPSPHAKTTAQGSHHRGTSLLAHQAPVSHTGSGDALETSKHEVKYTLEYSQCMWAVPSFLSGIYGMFIHTIEKAPEWRAEVAHGLALAWNFPQKVSRGFRQALGLRNMLCPKVLSLGFKVLWNTGLCSAAVWFGLIQP